MTSILLITMALGGLNLGIIQQTPHFTSCEALLTILLFGGVWCLSWYHLLVHLKPSKGLPMGLSLAIGAASATVTATVHDPSSKRVRARVAEKIRQSDNAIKVDEGSDDPVTAAFPRIRQRIPR